MGASWITPEALVLVAGAFFVLGYLVIDQVKLRILLFVGTGFYIWYYATVAEEPLWAAIRISMVLGLANLIGLGVLLARRSPLAVPRAHRDIYLRFHDLPPGDFRALVGAARRETIDAERLVTREGDTVNALYYVVSGGVRVEKRGVDFTMPAGIFVGEVAYLTRRVSSASTWIEAGSEILIWDTERLRRYSAKKPRFKLALEAMISKDLATKVAFAVAPIDRDAAEAEALAYRF